MKLSTHLDLSEVIRSDSAKRNGISNMPTEEHIANFMLLAEKIFEPIREHFGVPIRISSGYRSKELNAKIRGSATSQHCKGEAIDMTAGSKEENKKLFDWCKANLVFDQLIWEYGNTSGPDWVHISFRQGQNRNMVVKIK